MRATQPTQCPIGTYCPSGAEAPSYWTRWVIAVSLAIIFALLCFRTYHLLRRFRFPVLRPQGCLDHIAPSKGFLPACLDRLAFLRIFHVQRKWAARRITRWVRTTPRWRTARRTLLLKKRAMALVRRWCRRHVRRKRAARVIQRRIRSTLRAGLDSAPTKLQEENRGREDPTAVASTPG